MTRSVLSSLLLLALIGPVYVAIMGTCCSTDTNCKTCPDDGNPCTLGAYDTTLEATCNHPAWTDFRECVASDGGPGWCSGGACAPQQCVHPSNGIPYSNFPWCSYLPTGGGDGVCIDGRCIEGGGVDKCVKAALGRINCCTTVGCETANGSLCAEPAPDGTLCDPTRIEPWGGEGQTGKCLNGICQSGEQPDGSWTCHGLETVPNSGTYGRCGDGKPCTVNLCDPDANEANRCPMAIEVMGATCGVSQASTCCAGNCGPCVPICPPTLCNDNNSCTIDVCDPSKVLDGACAPGFECCEHTPRQTGSDCYLPGDGQQPSGKCDSVGVCFNFCSP